MWSIGISVSPCEAATRLGYDDRQINRIVIRMAQYFLDRDMRVVFGHDWREDGVMRAVADFAGTVAARKARDDDREAEPRMLNIVPAEPASLSSAAIQAARDSGGVLRVAAISEVLESVTDSVRIEGRHPDADPRALRAAQLTALRSFLTGLLSPGCRICLGGRLHGFEGTQPGVKEEATLALEHEKPLYLMGGFGGAARAFGTERASRLRYRDAWNGLNNEDKQDLFGTTDVEQAIRLISRGIDECQKRAARTR